MTTAALAPRAAEKQTDFTILHEFPSLSVELAWRDCLDRVACPAHYSAPEYFRDPNRADERRFAILAMKGNRVTGVLTGAHEGGHAACGQISRPQICIDEEADAAGTQEALVRGLLHQAARAKVISVYSWHRLDGFLRAGFRERAMEGVVVLDLRQGSEALFRQLDKKRRNCIRSAMRREVEVFEARRERDVEDFYEVYSAWFRTTRKKIEGPKLSFAFFQARFRHRENIRMFLARHSGKVVAGITLRFFPGGLVEYANNSSLDNCLHLRPNDLLLWHAIKWACSEGFAQFSLGAAHRFLREFGGALTPIYRYRLDRTLLRRHDLEEKLTDWGRGKLHQMPLPIENAIRKLTGKR